MWAISRRAVRAGSPEEDEVMGPCEAALMSKPAVKARGPRPLRTMARTEGSCARRAKRGAEVEPHPWGFSVIVGRVWGDLLFYEGVELLGAVDLDVGDIFGGEGDLEVLDAIVVCHDGGDGRRRNGGVRRDEVERVGWW